MTDSLDPDVARERLEAAARDRWGDGWTIQQLHFADGSSQSFAYRISGQREKSNRVEKDRLFIGADGGVYHDRVVVDQEQVVEVLDRDEPPKDVRRDSTNQPVR